MTRPIARYWTLLSCVIILSGVLAALFANDPANPWLKVVVLSPAIAVVGVGTYFRSLPITREVDEAPARLHSLGVGYLLLLLLGLDTYVVFGNVALRPATAVWGLLMLASGRLNDWSKVRWRGAWAHRMVKWGYFSLTTIGVALAIVADPYGGMLCFLLANQLDSFVDPPDPIRPKIDNTSDVSSSSQ